MKRLAFCLFRYFPYGGLQRDMVKFAKACQKRGWDITVFTMKWEGTVPAGIDVRILKTKGHTNHTRAINFSREFAEVIAKEKFAAVVGFNKMPGLDVYFAADICFVEEQKTKHRLYYRYMQRYQKFSQLERAVFGGSSHAKVMMISKTQMDVYNQYYNKCKSRMILLPPGTPSFESGKKYSKNEKKSICSELGISYDSKLILQIGSDYKRKGVRRSIMAIAALPKSIQKKTCLIIIGAGNASYYRRLAKKLSVRERIFFLKTRDDVPAFLKAGDLLIHPAYSENTGTVLLEALALGCPVLCSGVCGYATYVEEAEAGIVLKEPFTQQELNEKLCYVLETPDVLKQFSSNALSYAKQADIYSMHEKGADIIEETAMKNHMRQCKVSREPKHQASSRIKGSSSRLMLYLNKEFKKLWVDKDPFEEVDKLEGEIFRSIKNRRTLRFEVDGKSYFLKLHKNIGWKEILKNLIQLKKTAVGAKSEWLGINRLKELNIHTMTPVAYGLKGINPAHQYSFIITENLKNTVSLEDFCKNWQKNPPSFALKLALLKYVTHVTCTLHTNNINHRDYYLCHFLLECPDGAGSIDPENIIAYLIDLHRTQIRKKTPVRWFIKDVSGIYFSSMDIGLTRNDLFRFIKGYSGKSLRRALHEDKYFWRAVTKKAKRTYKRDFGKLPTTVI